jgi:hypothetical protein
MEEKHYFFKNLMPFGSPLKYIVATESLSESTTKVPG